MWPVEPNHRKQFFNFTFVSISKPAMMNKLLPVFLLAWITTIASAQETKSNEYRTALGIRLSNNDAIVNNSITIKHFFNRNMAIEGLLSFGDPVAIGALIELHRPVGGASGLRWLYGGGAYYGFGSPNNFGAQGILGLDYKIGSIPLNLSLDWKPELNFISDFGFEPAAVGFSARFAIR